MTLDGHVVDGHSNFSRSPFETGSPGGR
jgi:hypothetical protein